MRWPKPTTDLHDALEIFRRLDDRPGMAFTLSFYTETARLVGNMDEARRRRLETLSVYPADSDDDLRPRRAGVLRTRSSR